MHLLASANSWRGRRSTISPSQTVLSALLKNRMAHSLLKIVFRGRIKPTRLHHASKCRICKRTAHLVLLSSLKPMANTSLRASLQPLQLPGLHLQARPSRMMKMRAQMRHYTRVRHIVRQRMPILPGHTISARGRQLCLLGLCRTSAIRQHACATVTTASISQPILSAL